MSDDISLQEAHRVAVMLLGEMTLRERILHAQLSQAHAAARAAQDGQSHDLDVGE